jgi:hypothetical protein
MSRKRAISWEDACSIKIGLKKPFFNNLDRKIRKGRLHHVLECPEFGQNFWADGRLDLLDLRRTDYVAQFVEFFRVQMIIYCQYCGTDNRVEPGVLDKPCQKCGETIDNPEIQNAPRAMADRAGDVLRVVCPRCQFVNEFPGMDGVYAFLCHHCGQPVRVDEP